MKFPRHSTRNWWIISSFQARRHNDHRRCVGRHVTSSHCAPSWCLLGFISPPGLFRTPCCCPTAACTCSCSRSSAWPRCRRVPPGRPTTQWPRPCTAAASGGSTRRRTCRRTPTPPVTQTQTGGFKFEKCNHRNLRALWVKIMLEGNIPQTVFLFCWLAFALVVLANSVKIQISSAGVLVLHENTIIVIIM